MKPAELIIKSIDFINQSQCNVILKNDDVIKTFGELILIKDKNGDYAYSGFGTKIEDICVCKDKIYPIFDIDKELYDDPDILQKVRIAIAGAITEHCALKDL